MTRHSNLFRNLLIAMGLYIVTFPLLISEGPWGEITEAVFGLGILVTGIQASRRMRPIQSWIKVILSGFIVSTVCEIIRPEQIGFSIARCLFALFFYARFVVLVGQDVFLVRRVDVSSRLYGAVCVYMLLAILFADIFVLIETLWPGSFYCSEALCPSGVPVFHQGTQIYYSLITLTTLGYGDMSPARPVAAMLAGAEAVIGQMYVGIMVARLVGLHLMESPPESDRSS